MDEGALLVESLRAMKRRVTDAQAGFEGGLNTTADESQLGPKQVRQSENARLTEYGGVTKRLGTRRIHALSLGNFDVRGGFSWRKTDGTVQELIVANAKLHTATFSPTATVWTERAGALSMLYPAFAAFRDGSAEVAYIADGGPLNRWDGTTLSVDLADTPPVGLLAVYNLRLFGAGNSAAKDTLYWSDFDDGDTLGDVANGGGSARVRTFGISEITGLTPLGSALLIWHRDGISRFTGWSQDDIDIDAGTEGITQDVGTISPRTILVVENYAYFLSDRGVYRTNGQTVEEISPSISSIFRTLDRNIIERAVAVHNRKYGEIWFYLPDVGIYVFNYRWQAWSGPWTGFYSEHEIHSLWETVDSDSAPIILAGASDGLVRQCDVAGFYLDDIQTDITEGAGGAGDYFGSDYFGSDYYGSDYFATTGLVDQVVTTGDVFEMLVRCRRFYFGDEFAEKSLRWIWVTAALRGSTTAMIRYQLQTRDGTKSLEGVEVRLWGEGIWGEGIWDRGGSQRLKIPADGRGVSLDVTIEDSGASDAVYSRIEAEAFVMGRR